MNLKEFNNLVDFFFYQADKQKQDEIFLEWLNPVYRKSYTWSETVSNIYKISKVIKQNCKEGDRVLLISENRPEWFMSDLAIMLSKAITVPTYTTYTTNDYRYLIEDCEPSIIIISNNFLHKKIENVILDKKFINKIITFDNVAKGNDIKKYLDFQSIIKTKLLEGDKIKKINSKRDSPACIIYTSGTGGNPKGGILSHGGILNNLEGAKEIVEPLI